MTYLEWCTLMEKHGWKKDDTQMSLVDDVEHRAWTNGKRRVEADEAKECFEAGVTPVPFG